MQNKNSRLKCNVLLIGQTGSGKSSFANYLFGVDKFTTGSGLPVTTWEENFQNWMLVQDGVEINVYDSVGLEHDNIEKWKDKMYWFLNNLQGSYGEMKNANDILHVFFYVINAASARVQDSEMEIIEIIQNKYNISTAVVLTNCDTAKDNEVKRIENVIRKKFNEMKIIRVCSISRKNRSGQITKPFGKDQAVAQVLEASYEKVGIEVLRALFSRTYNFLDDMHNKIRTRIKNSDISIFAVLRDEKAIEKSLGDLLENWGFEELDIYTFLPKSHKSYIDFLEKFPVQWQGKDTLSHHLDRLEEILDISEDEPEFVRSMDRAIHDIEYGNVFEKIKGVFTAGGKAVFLKKTLLEGVDSMFIKVKFKIHCESTKI